MLVRKKAWFYSSKKSTWTKLTLTILATKCSSWIQHLTISSQQSCSWRMNTSLLSRRWMPWSPTTNGSSSSTCSASCAWPQTSASSARDRPDSRSRKRTWPSTHCKTKTSNRDSKTSWMPGTNKLPTKWVPRTKNTWSTTWSASTKNLSFGKKDATTWHHSQPSSKTKNWSRSKIYLSHAEGIKKWKSSTSERRTWNSN